MLGTVPVERDRQVRAIDLGDLDRILVKLPSSKTIQLRIRDAYSIGNSSVGIKFGQFSLAAGERDFAGIAGVGDIGLRRGIKAPGEIALQGNVLAADDGAVDVGNAVAPAGEDISFQSLRPEFEFGVLVD